VVKGADAAAAALEDWLETWSGYEVEVLEAIETPGDRVFTSLRQRATGAASGVPFEGELFQVWTFNDGRPIRMEFFFDRQKAMAAARLAQPAS
jgi:ketosteroid isomerase-like protein